MIKLEKTVLPSYEQWQMIIEGMRNPMNSWDKSDSYKCEDSQIECRECPYYREKCSKNNFDYCIIGPNDLKLMKNLVKAGKDHRKFMRMITVYVNIRAPLYWWKEFDTYKVGTLSNSCSTMHKIHAKEFTLDDFSHDHLEGISPDYLLSTIDRLNNCRAMYLVNKNKDWWWQLIQLLPTSYNQKRTVMLNYEVLANVYHSRKNHKLDEWREFCKWIESLPYTELITGGTL